MLGGNHFSWHGITAVLVRLPISANTAKIICLAPRKDLAVSYPDVAIETRRAHNKLYARRLMPFGTRRLCSHLSSRPGRLLAATLTWLAPNRESGPSSPPAPPRTKNKKQITKQNKDIVNG